jgi:hypothetical protein
MRRFWLWTGLVGLIANAVLVAVVIAAHRALRWSPVARDGAGLAVVLFFFCLSCAEIPLMVYALRWMAADRKGNSRWLCGAANAFYVFFAAVYAAVVLALTGWWAVGLGLSALGLVRLASSLWWIPEHPEATF